MSRNISQQTSSEKPRAISSYRRTVYLAGKITVNCWRHSLVPTLRGADADGSVKVLPTTAYEVVTNGPFFTSCDHGCSHGEGTHGVGEGCSGSPYRQSEVYARSLRAIKEADWLFCWIDDVGAYGTCVEVGYARALGKPVYVAMSERAPAILCSDMWFLFEGHKIRFFRNENDAFKAAVNWFRTYEPKTSTQEEVFQ